MGYNTQGRKWALVINNPQEAGLDHKAIVDLLKLFSPAYYCLCDEIATTGTYHTHVFFYAPSPVRFGTIKGRFSTAHIEKAYGSVQVNRDYLRKEGRWTDSERQRLPSLAPLKNGAKFPRNDPKKIPKCPT